jgi:ATP-binding cassette subfamily F protein 2
MASRWHQKKAKQAEEAFERELQEREDEAVDVTALTKAAAMGGGDDQIFEKKLSKEEKKALAKAKREAKRKGKKKDSDDDDDDDGESRPSAMEVLKEAKGTLAATTEVMEGTAAPGVGGVADDGIDHEAADALASAGTICTFSASRKGVDARARDINVSNFTLQHMGAVLLDETEIILNHGNRYGLIGRNGCGKSTLLRALGARAIPIPNSIDIFFLKEEVEPSETMTALDAVMSVDEERLKLEKQAEDLNHLMTEIVENPPKEEELDENGEVKTAEEIQEEIMEALNLVYERLDALDADTAEVRARSILSGLGFTHEMQSKKTKDFSGGWRMRVSLARALFIQPVW